MKTTIFAGFVILLVIAMACQNKLALDKEYVTSISGTLTYKTRGVVAPVKAGSFDTTSDANGNYSLTVIHDGSFLFTAGSLINYSENIETKSETIIRNVAR